MLVPRQEYSRKLKIACMRELGLAEVARSYQLSPRRLETWKSEWRAKGELAFSWQGCPSPIPTGQRAHCYNRHEL
jgi:hypothetical protein